MASTYAGLTQEIIDYAIRTGDTTFASYIPNFISYAETWMNRILRIRVMEQNATANLNTMDANGGISLPNDYLEIRAISVNTNPVTDLQYVTAQKMFQLQSQQANTYTSTPLYFTIIGGQMRFFPQVDSSSTLSVNIVYYGKPAPLTTNTTNNVLIYYPDLYLHASLLQAYIFLKDQSGIAFETQALTSIINDIEKADVRAEYPGLAAYSTDTVY